VKVGDLVESIKHGVMGIVVEIFDDLNPESPWVRVLFTTPVETFRWCKKDSLVRATKKEEARVAQAPSE